MTQVGGLAILQAVYAVPLAVAGAELVLRAASRLGAPRPLAWAVCAAWAVLVWLVLGWLTAAAI